MNTDLGELEKLFNKTSLVAKRNYNRGRMIKEKWIFANTTRKKLGFLEFAADRGTETM